MANEPTPLHGKRSHHAKKAAAGVTPAKPAKAVKKAPVRVFAIFEDAQKIALRLIKRNLEGLAELAPARILYLSTSRDKVGRDGAASAAKYWEAAKAVREFDFVLTFARPAWNRYTEVQREAIVYHELLHCRIDGKGRAQIVGHDLEEFELVIKHYGIWDPRVRRVHAQMVLWAEEPDGSAAAGTFRRAAARKE